MLNILIYLLISLICFYSGYYIGQKRAKIENSLSDDVEYILSDKEMIEDFKNIEKAKSLYKLLSKKAHPDINQKGAEIQSKLNKYKRSFTILSLIQKKYFD